VTDIGPTSEQSKSLRGAPIRC